MMNRLVLLLLLFALACTPKATYEVKPDGVWVTFQNNDTKRIALQPVSDKIIRVTAAPTHQPKQTESLSVITQPTFVDWQAEEIGNDLLVTTKSIRAKLSLLTGEIVFTDTTGKVLLQEKVGGGKTYQATTADNENFYTIQQEFESPADEAFYGLGQHQEGLMNYKGKDVTLFQYNTKVSVPFLVSTKNYGLLWDNYSLSKFGDVREYKQLSALNLFSKDGVAGGLTANYISKTDSNKVYLSRTDSVINYRFLADQKIFPQDFPLANGKVVWEGSLSTNQTGTHKFFIYYAGYLKVWVNNQLQADHWRQAWNPGQIKLELDAEAGKKYPVRIEWLPDGGESYLSITWQQNSKEEQNRLSLFSEAADQIDYYFVAGNNLDEVIGGYRTLTGKAEIVPNWALGFWQSRERYKTQKEILDVAAEFRKRRIPLDNIVLDWSYWDEDKWGSQDFDLKRFRMRIT
jgi:alpha-D-xyloside xylohydrolase